MKNSSGISVISIIVTIIVIIIISSVTVFTGTNLLNSAREDKAKERLEVIYEALIKDELAFGIRDTVEERTLQNDDYMKLGLEGYANDKQMPTVTFSKRIGGIVDTTDATMRTYTLKTFLTMNSTDTYEIQKEFSVLDNKYSTDVLFDSAAGANRPQLTSDMVPVSFANSEVGEFVDDIYTQRWYSYDSKAPNYANAEIELNGEKRTYVWIPRYAYKIQDYYKDNVLLNVPESAIEIIFLKGTTDTDANDNILPKDYIVHPAFSYDDTALAGIWVEKYSQETVDTIGEVFDESLSLYNTEVAHSHLLKNSEWSAMAYLAHSCGAAKASSSTNNNSGVQDINTSGTEYIAAYISDSSTSELEDNGSSLKDGENKDKDEYTTTGNFGTLNSTNPTSIGDALVETSNGENDKSAWFNSTTIQPRPETPFIARGTSDSVFGFKATDGDEESAYYRTTLIVETNVAANVIVGSTDSKYVKVAGDTFLYEPAISGFNFNTTYYVVWDESGNESTISLTEDAPSNWYNYTDSKWANVMVESSGNKAYFVWIPRYVYKLDSSTQTSEVRFVDINNKYKDEFGNVEQITLGDGSDDWKIPSAFTWDNTPIPGYWMSKYQVSNADGFYVERFANKITVKSIDAAVARLGNGPYSYYRGSTLIGTADSGESFTFKNLVPNTVYKIKIVGSNGVSIERNISTIGSIPTIVVTTPEEPDLSGFNRDNTYYVTWNRSGVETHTPISERAPEGWYDYSEKKWANIVVKDDVNKLYLVWIPRYKYKLDYADKNYNDFISGDTGFGYSEVKFISASSGKAGELDDEGYVVPEAFAFDGEEISGYWMSKYQISEIDNFYVERSTNYIRIKPVNANISSSLGTGRYLYYLDGRKIGDALLEDGFKFSDLQPNTTYEIKVVGTNGKELIRNIKTIGTIPIISDTTSNMEAPDLSGFEENLTFYVTWDSDGNETLTSITETAPSNWYDYTNKKWANILVQNGENKAYFVWIPRYRYKLENDLLLGEQTYIQGYDSAFEYAEVQFISKGTGEAGTEDSNGYIIPEAFAFGGDELAGYWISKYQVSAND